MTAVKPRQLVKAGDRFLVNGVRVCVLRVSRNPEKPWVDITCQSLASGWLWSKRMPTGIPANWPPIDAAGNWREFRTEATS